MQKDKIIRQVITEVNKSLQWYKKGGWIDSRKTPDSGQNMVEDIREFIEARISRELWEIPELRQFCDYMDGNIGTVVLEGANEETKKYKEATFTLVEPSELNDDATALDLREKALAYLGGNVLKFNGMKQKIKYNIENE